MKALDFARLVSTPTQDVILSRRILNGEKNLFGLLLRPYDETIQRTLAVLVGHEGSTAEVVMRTYLRAFKTLYRFHGQTSLPAWLLSIGIGEARKHRLNFNTGAPALSETEWLCVVLRKCAGLKKKDIAYCLTTTREEVRRNLKAAGRMIRERTVTVPASAGGCDDELTRDLCRCLAGGENEAHAHISREMNLIVDMLIEEHKRHETRIPMDIEQEHRENLMLCNNIRLGFIKGVELDRIKRYTDWYWQNHLLTHFRHEEKEVVPVLGRQHGLVKKALAQHRRLKRLFESKEDIHKMLNRIEEELMAHVRFEEKILLKEIEKSG